MVTMEMDLFFFFFNFEELNLEAYTGCFEIC